MADKEDAKTEGDKKDKEDEGERVVVKKWNAVVFWSYAADNDNCAICHNALIIPCIMCEAEPNRAEECHPSWGMCSHGYHFHCITKWLKTRSTCPLDDEEFVFAEST